MAGVGRLPSAKVPTAPVVGVSTLNVLPATVVLTVAPPSGGSVRLVPPTTMPAMPPWLAPSVTVGSSRASPPLTVSTSAVVWYPAVVKVSW